MSERVRILLVDDEKEFLTATQRIISSLGYGVECASSGSQALDLYKKSSFGLLITDLKMPVMDGFELVHKIRAINPAQRIIISTAMYSQVVPWNKRFTCSDAPGEGVDMSTINYLFKPYSKASLVSAIEKTLKGETFGAECDASARPAGEEAAAKSTGNQDPPPPLDCFYFIDLYRLGKRSVSLEVRRNGCSGRIFIKDGDIIHAESSSLTGEEALKEILSWENVQIKLDSCPCDLKRTIYAPYERLFDKKTRNGQGGDGNCGLDCIKKGNSFRGSIV